MTLFESVLILATLLCSLVAGFLFAFATVVMPGIKNLDDGAFIRAFQVIDGVVQRMQPLFVFVWVGSALAVLAVAGLSLWQGGTERVLAIAAALIYLLGVQLSTVTINIPLNNQLQKQNVGTMDEAMRRRAREAFEPRWNRWNVIRSIWACVASALLMLLLLRA